MRAHNGFHYVQDDYARTRHPVAGKPLGQDRRSCPNPSIRAAHCFPKPQLLTLKSSPARFPEESRSADAKHYSTCSIVAAVAAIADARNHLGALAEWHSQDFVA